MYTILAFIITLGILVTIHEYGHFIVARYFDVKVLRFAIGFGKPLWQTTFGQDKTEFVVAAIPLGGYVKMLDENELRQESESNDAAKKHYSEESLSRAYNRLHVFKRMTIVLAGPIANLLLAILLYWGLISLGIVGLKPIIGTVTEDSAAAVAGLHTGDRIQAIDETRVQSWQDVRWQILNKMADKESVSVQVYRGNGDTSYGTQKRQLTVNTINQDDTKNDLLTQLGLKPHLPQVKPIIGTLLEDGAATKAGLQSKDLIVSVNGRAIDSWETFVSLVQNSPERPLKLTINRNHQTVDLMLTPESVKNGNTYIGKIGAGVYFSESDLADYYVTTKYGAFEALLKATKKTWETSVFSLKMMGNMLIGKVSWKMMSGPVTIANYAGQSANMGLKAFIGFLALMSISIGVINLLPIPVLDGGHFMYYVIEFVTGKPVSESVMIAGQKVGLFLIGGMMMMAFYNDINRLITG